MGTKVKPYGRYSLRIESIFSIRLISERSSVNQIRNRACKHSAEKNYLRFPRRKETKSPFEESGCQPGEAQAERNRFPGYGMRQGAERGDRDNDVSVRGMEDAERVERHRYQGEGKQAVDQDGARQPNFPDFPDSHERVDRKNRVEGPKYQLNPPQEGSEKQE